MFVVQRLTAERGGKDLVDAIRVAVGDKGFGLPGIVALDHRIGGLEKNRSRHGVKY